MRRFLFAFTASLLLFAVSAGTALMATPTVGATCGFDGALGTVSFIYDASLTPPPVTTVQVVNNDTTSVQVSARFYDLTTLALLWSGSALVAPGTRTFDVTSLGFHMVRVTGKSGPYWAFPVVVSCT